MKHPFKWVQTHPVLGLIQEIRLRIWKEAGRYRYLIVNYSHFGASIKLLVSAVLAAHY
jgi:hypothetical protein